VLEAEYPHVGFPPAVLAAALMLFALALLLLAALMLFALALLLLAALTLFALALLLLAALMLFALASFLVFGALGRRALVESFAIASPFTSALCPRTGRNRQNDRHRHYNPLCACPSHNCLLSLSEIARV